jgi:proton glutamate symport protein
MKLALHWKILIGLVLGLAFGYFMKTIDAKDFVTDWIKPFGTVFINLLKMIAVPLIVVSLITGLADLKDISKLSKLGSRTVALYLFTTVLAVTIGLVLANIVNQGKFINAESRQSLLENFAGDASKKIELAVNQKSKGPLQPLLDIVPDNIFGALSNNGSMLQVILFVILVGIGLILIEPEKAKPVTDFFKGFNDVILKIIDLIMLIAPIGVFSLMSALMVEIPDFSVLQALLIYAFTVVTGLLLMTYAVYPTLLVVLAKYPVKKFFSAMAPAQILAFSTSSSAATLPVTMERVIEHVGVEEEVASFVLPLGATVNMDGTSLYQAVAAIFIAQAFSMDLTFSQQVMIILTATLASIGTAAVPSAGMVTLVIILGQAGIPEAGLALIFAIDRPLDMLRTVTNVTSDAAVATIVASSVGKLNKPEPHEWDENLKK